MSGSIQRRAVRLVKPLWLVSSALVAVNLWLTVWRGGSIASTLAISVVQLSFMTVGALLSMRLPSNPLGWLFIAIASFVLAAGAGEAYARAALRADSSLPGGTAAAVVAEQFQGPVLIGLLVALLLLFPDGRLPSRRWRHAARAGAVACMAAVLSTALVPGPLNVAEVDNPIALGGAAGTAMSVVQGIAFLTMMGLVVVSAASLVLRFRAATGELRQQLKWLVSAAALVGVAFVCAIPLWSISAAWSEVVWTSLFAVATTALPVATGIAVLRYRLYEIDVIIRKTLVYAGVVVPLAVVYVGGVSLLGWAFRSVTGESGVLAVTLSTLAVAAVFQPVRTRVQRAVDHRFYRGSYDAARTMEAFSGRLRQQVDLDAVHAEVLAVVAETLQPSHLGLWLRETGAGR